MEVLGTNDSRWYSALNGEELMGVIGFCGISWPDGCADVAMGVVPKWRGHGVAKELAKIQNAYAFLDLGLRRLQMFALKGSPSCKIARSAGLTLEGTLKGCRLKRGVYHDAEIYALVREG
jgi:RimJ/RimL family protein N-acetyltransferase